MNLTLIHFLGINASQSSTGTREESSITGSGDEIMQSNEPVSIHSPNSLTTGAKRSSTITRSSTRNVNFEEGNAGSNDSPRSIHEQDRTELTDGGRHI